MSTPRHRLSVEARARALSRGPGAAGFLLAHHGPGQLNRCYSFWAGDRPVWLCARCLGLYPALLMALLALLWIRLPAGWWDAPWLFLLLAPALWDWGTCRLGSRSGSNAGRTISGAVLGVSLARGLSLHLVSPGDWLALSQFSFLALSILAIEGAARLGARRTKLPQGGEPSGFEGRPP